MSDAAVEQEGGLGDLFRLFWLFKQTKKKIHLKSIGKLMASIICQVFGVFP